VIPERLHNLANLKLVDVVGNPIERCAGIAGLILDWQGYLRLRATIQSTAVIRLYLDMTRDVGQASDLLQIGRLTALRSLYVTGDYDRPVTEAVLAPMVSGIGELKNLQHLEFDGVRMQTLPEPIKRLKSLHTLVVANGGLPEVPRWISDLTALRTLDLRSNEISGLPDTAGKMVSLERLVLSKNPLADFPEPIFRMKALEGLVLSARDGSAYIREIPPEIVALENLKQLDIDGHPIETPPPEVVDRGAESVKNYWRQRQEVGIDYLCEAKLIIVGEAGAGKTSLARKIEDREYELQDRQPSTEGIEVIPWSFRAAIRVSEGDREKLLERDFRVRIWDFGGQEVYHATHQFFLTHRSVYVLVADERKEDTDFNYWLRVVDLLSGSSPLLIVQNEKGDRKRALDIGALRSRFGNVRAAFGTNLATNRGLDEVVKAIRDELQNLPHIGAALPRTWKRVRERLEQDQRDFISREQYIGLSREHGFTREEDALQLSGYLHDLGVCLHFQDDDVLKHTVILNPKWGTDAVYRVLDDVGVKAQNGHFDRTDLERIWSEGSYARMRPELLRLMMNFQLCYELPQGGAYIAPQLLSPVQPIYPWPSTANLVLRYKYDFMPKGIVTRVIVALHSRIADQTLVWRTGVILVREGTLAELIEDYARGTITLRIEGPDARGLLAIADHELERIHASFPNLRFDKYLPCRCEVCRNLPDPYAYPLEELKRFAGRRQKRQCGLSGELVDAATLIADILPEALKRDAGVPGIPEIFVSYAWSGESTRIVDGIEAALRGTGIGFSRDRNELRYKDSIRDFMRRLGRGKAVVVILSNQYL